MRRRGAERDDRPRARSNRERQIRFRIGDPLARKGAQRQRGISPHACAYALKGEIERAPAELAEARRLSRDDRYTSIARVKETVRGTIRALWEATVLVGLRKAGMLEE